MGGEENDKTQSEFVELSAKADAVSLVIFSSTKDDTQKLYSSDLPDVDLAVRRNLASMLGRSPPNEAETADMIRKQ